MGKINTLKTIRNPFRGINPHMHSFYFAEGYWNRIHNPHAVQVMQMLKRQLLPIGYTATVEESLQIRRGFEGVINRPEGDITIRDMWQRPMGNVAVMEAAVEAVPLMAIMEAEDIRENPYSAVIIYPTGKAGKLNDVVAWIELLSPTVKGNTTDAKTYFAKRENLLHSGIVFVELDYIHELSPTYDWFPDYSRGEDGATPYLITVTDPRPTYEQGVLYPYRFGVDDPLPTVRIPLNDGDKVDFDFNAAYQKTFSEGLYGADDVDYARLPHHFERYSPHDQAIIANRMLALYEALQAGKDLEQDVIEPVNLPLDEAVRRIEDMTETSPLSPTP
jgi:hypothetical protein